MHRHNFFLPKELVEALRLMAEQRDTTVSALIREALTAFVAQKEQGSTDE
jgi:predicted transcriptional regulator